VLLSRQKNSSERGLTDLRARKAALQGRLTKVEADLESAVDHRRRTLCEGDDSQPLVPVVELMDNRSALLDAIAVDNRIGTIEAKVLAARDHAARLAESEIRSKQIERLREALRAHEATGKEVVEAIAPLAPLNIEIANAAANAKMWTDGVSVAVETAIARSTVYVGAVAAGTVPIVAQQQPDFPYSSKKAWNIKGAPPKVSTTGRVRWP
jgi:hypothetical protein